MIISPKDTHDSLIMKGVYDHYKEALEYFPENQIVGCFLQGSQNYGLDYENSDIDTKLIVIPNFKDICLNKKPISHTHIRENNEHTDWKDVRLYMETFRKQNLNFLEILFTPYFIINPLYKDQWDRLIASNEKIAKMNPYRAVKSMKGIALEKYYAMEHKYPSKIDIIEAYGYDGKQVSHLLRVDDYLTRYINGEDYKNCLRPSQNLINRIMDYKKLDKIPLDEAREEAKRVLAHTEEIANAFCADLEDNENQEIRDLLEDVSYNILKISIKKELK